MIDAMHIALAMGHPFAECRLSSLRTVSTASALAAKGLRIDAGIGLQGLYKILKISDIRFFAVGLQIALAEQTQRAGS